ncbi:hypothetical protein KZZ52_49365 [Dactylosporangium sp. AC04546]|uniref:hypothetical protein n=1 Tax=Dactylosporangium sp. AC04546 TaxID=2862460 RepID=UPI001EDCA4B9|nr:hypothetical protein [Dactylosporangium sp. AC04546]WVK81897.1 hypothetical protein KZZ52_49365 [Dactylosporangium sp. AC04546]
MTAPAPRHRRPRASLRARLTTAALVLVTLVAGSLIILAKPDQARLQRPFFVSGTAGGPVSLHTLTVTVLETTGAPKLQTSRGVLETTGMWVTVRLRVVATEEPVMLQYARLRDDRDRLFHATNRVDQQLAGGRMFQPGIPVEGTVVFEVAKDARALTLLVSHDPGTLNIQLEGVAEIELPAPAEAWRTQEKPVTVPSAKVVE